jgi:ppGpp synthetase/RelA/SpoT-type nucleotidyltranferase
MPTQEIIDHTTEDLLNELGNYRPEFKSPGYWKALDSNSSQWATDISVGIFWGEVKKRLTLWRSEYRSSTNSDLLTSFDLPDFVAKPSGSIINKLLRYHQKESIQGYIPAQGPPIPKIGDIVRTRIKCQYIDGVEFLATKLQSLSTELGLETQRERQGKIEGYFAQHINISQEVIFREAGIGQLAKITCEIQIASSMASQMWQTSHPLYETVRSDMSQPDNWQWKPHDPRFISNQLGHMIHLADGLLVQLRDLKKSKKE